MAVFGHSGSQAPQLMHSLVMTVAMAARDSIRATRASNRDTGPRHANTRHADGGGAPACVHARAGGRPPGDAGGGERSPVGARAPPGGLPRLRRSPARGDRARREGPRGDPRRPRLRRRQGEEGRAQGAAAREEAPGARAARRADEGRLTAELPRAVAIAILLAATPAGAAGDHELQAAQAELKIARDHLEAAGPDYGGHRRAAIDLIDRAQQEIRRGLDVSRG